MLAVIDYQMGNLRSVQKGFEKVGHAATITSDPRELERTSARYNSVGFDVFGAVAQLVRVPDCRSGGCGFEPRRPR